MAQENKNVVINLKTGYSVKGEIVEKTADIVKIITLNGEIFEYKTDEIESIGTSSSPTLKLLKSENKIPSPVAKGDMLFSSGVGFFVEKVYDNIVFPPIPVTFEYVLLDDLFDGNGSVGVGGFFGYVSSKNDNRREVKKYSRLTIGGRAYVHYTFIEKLDTYAGAFVGIKSVKDVLDFNGDTNDYYDFYYQKDVENSAAINLFAGCRYFFTNNIAGMAELSWGISVLTIGASIKF